MYTVVEWSCIGYMQCTVCRVCLEIGCTVYSKKQPLSTQNNHGSEEQYGILGYSIFSNKAIYNKLHSIIVPCLYPSYVYLYIYTSYSYGISIYHILYIYHIEQPFKKFHRRPTEKKKKNRRLPRHFGHFLLVHRLKSPWINTIPIE